MRPDPQKIALRRQAYLESLIRIYRAYGHLHLIQPLENELEGLQVLGRTDARQGIQGSSAEWSAGIPLRAVQSDEELPEADPADFQEIFLERLRERWSLQDDWGEAYDAAIRNVSKQATGMERSRNRLDLAAAKLADPRLSSRIEALASAKSLLPESLKLLQGAMDHPDPETRELAQDLLEQAVAEGMISPQSFIREIRPLDEVMERLFSEGDESGYRGEMKPVLIIALKQARSAGQADGRRIGIPFPEEARRLVWAGRRDALVRQVATDAEAARAGALPALMRIIQLASSDDETIVRAAHRGFELVNAPELLLRFISDEGAPLPDAEFSARFPPSAAFKAAVLRKPPVIADSVGLLSSNLRGPNKALRDAACAGLYQLTTPDGGALLAPSRYWHCVASAWEYGDFRLPPLSQADFLKEGGASENRWQAYMEHVNHVLDMMEDPSADPILAREALASAAADFKSGREAPNGFWDYFWGRVLAFASDASNNREIFCGVIGRNALMLAVRGQMGGNELIERISTQLKQAAADGLSAFSVRDLKQGLEEVSEFMGRG